MFVWTLSIRVIKEYRRLKKKKQLYFWEKILTYREVECILQSTAIIPFLCIHPLLAFCHICFISLGVF